MWVQIIRKDSVSIKTTFKQKDWTPIDITGYTVYFTVKTKADVNISNPTDSNAIILKDITAHTDPTQWETSIVLTTSDTNKTPDVYSADLQLKDAASKIHSSSRFDFEIIQEVTQRS